MIVDAYNFLFRAYFALPQLSYNGVPVGAVYGFMNILLKYIDTSPDYFVIASDTGKSTFREQIYDQYKIHRAPIPCDLTPQFFLLREMIAAFGFNFIERDSFEADDIIATLVKKFSNENLKIIIVSSDKDLMQLVSKHVVILDPIKNVFFGVEEVKTKFNVLPEQVIDFLSLTGDVSDNIPGIPGVGPKTAAKLLNKFGTLENINPDKIEQKKLRQNLTDFAELSKISKKLVTLAHDVEILQSLDDLKYKNPNEEKALEFLKKYGFKTLISRFGKFTQDVKKVEMIQNSTDLDQFLLHAKYSGIIAIYKVQEDIYITTKEEEFITQRQSFYEQFAQILHDNSIIKVLHSENFIPDYTFEYQDLKIMSYIINTTRTSISDLFLQYFVDSIEEEKYPQNMVAIYQKIQQDMLIYRVFTLYYKIDSKISKIINNMQKIGILVDKKYLKKLQIEFCARIEEDANEVFKATGEKFLISSPKQLADVLFDKMQIPVQKKSKTGAHSTDSEVLEMLSIQGFEIADKILKWRRNTKLKNTYIDPLLSRVIGGVSDRIHTTYQTTLTLTGRFSSVNPNLQNIPRSALMRKIFIAKDGHSLVSADYSQIELRILAYMANITALKDTLLKGQDLHAITAKHIFETENITDELRNRAKAINFGIVYGITGFGLAKQLGISREEASQYIKEYFAKYNGIKDYMEKTKKSVLENGFVTTQMGRRCYIENINSQNFTQRAVAERSAINAPIQGTAADIIRNAMVKIGDESDISDFLIMQIHDELVFEVPDEKISIISVHIKEIMEKSSSIPMKVEIKIGKNLGEMTKI